MNILSIQSWVAFGHVGNAAAIFPMQRLGVETWAVNTVQFSNHTGYGKWRGQVFSGDLVRDLVQGIEERGVLPTCTGVLSGYMGDAGIGSAVLDAVARVKQANPRALYCCDPVIGDVGRGVFVRPGIPEFMRDRAVPAADIVTPNAFELEWLTGMPLGSASEAVASCDALHAMGPKVILVTSLEMAGEDPTTIALMASDRGRKFIVRTPRLPLSVNGAGDAIAALFMVHYARTNDARAALENAASAIFGLLRRTAEAGSREILLVAAQDEFVNPTTRFTAEPLG
jgi:pyridoxine kinase